VTHFIENFIEPKRLLLVWQSPDLHGDRTRRIVGELFRSGDGHVTLRYLAGTNDFEETRQRGFAGYPAFPISHCEHRSNVLETFLRRLPPSGRSDYARYLGHLGMRPDAPISRFALLGYAGASLPSDDFSIVNPFDDAPAPCEFMTEVAGFRHQSLPASAISEGDKVDLQPEPQNEFDSKAILLSVNGQKIGYINRAQTAPFHDWLSRSQVEAVIERINGNPERPRVLLFVRVRVPRRAAA